MLKGRKEKQKKGYWKFLKLHIFDFYLLWHILSPHRLTMGLLLLLLLQPHKLVIIDLKNGVDFTSARKQDFHFRSSGKHT